ncbi:OLC1v1019096C1 [Oldenlandia corymbosa var. corymbosa]|uniref:OLC1v1019096C1 n=1 Tax=Oldenlandia corymbosa var. corymbosa TaxID=529605 RepID=A0AAV1ED84_OLDCO|nr:OLC1v1019096C1 [Oldenlandia corymbosa var. corymbosa]
MEKKNKAPAQKIQIQSKGNLAADGRGVKSQGGTLRSNTPSQVAKPNKQSQGAMGNPRSQGATLKENMLPAGNPKLADGPLRKGVTDSDASTSGLSRREKEAIPVDVSAPEVEKCDGSLQTEAAMTQPDALNDDDSVEMVYVEESPTRITEDLSKALVLFENSKKPGLLTDDNSVGLYSEVVEDTTNDDEFWSEGEKDQAVIVGDTYTETMVHNVTVRNKFLFDGMPILLNIVFDMIKRHVEDMQMIQAIQASTPAEKSFLESVLPTLQFRVKLRSLKVVKWKPPDADGLVLNTDGSSLGQSLNLGYGFSIRGAQGVVIYGESGFLALQKNLSLPTTQFRG